MAGMIVVTGAEIHCTMGIPGITAFMATPTGVTAGGLPVGTIMDFVPMENIPTFGMCQSLANPEVASATAAALGVLTPMPCIPVTTSPWAPGAVTTTVDEMPLLTEDCVCVCDFGGEISIAFPGQVMVDAT